MMNIKCARTTSRTQLKQQLMRQQAEEQEARERQRHLLELQCQQQHSQPLPTPQAAATRLHSVDVPNEVLQVGPARVWKELVVRTCPRCVTLWLCTQLTYLQFRR